MKSLIVTAMVLFVAVLGCKTSSNSGVKTQAANATPAPPPIAITAKELGSRYKENELAADNDFRDKPLEVTGKLKAVKEVLGTISIDLDATNYMTINCDVPDERRSQAAALKSGQTVTVIGTGNGLFGSTIVEMQDCRVK